MYIELSVDSIMASYQEPVVWDIDHWYSNVLVRALRRPFFQAPSLIEQSLEYKRDFYCRRIRAKVYSLLEDSCQADTKGSLE